MHLKNPFFKLFPPLGAAVCTVRVFTQGLWSTYLRAIVISPITGDSFQSAWEVDHLWKCQAEYEAHHNINNSPEVHSYSV